MVMIEQQQEQLAGANAVGQRLSLRMNNNSSTECSGMVVAYFPKTQKHRVRFDAEGREKNVRLNEWTVQCIDSRPSHKLSTLELAIRHDAAGRRLEVYNQVRQKWFQGTVLKYVEHCQQHALTIEPQGKVHLVDLNQQVWRYTDLLADQELPESSTLATSKYRGVQRFTETVWKAYYDNDEDLYIGCFGSEKDAALAYDVYARKRGTPVNFEDRRICRKVMKALRIPEPEVVEQQSVEAHPAVSSDESSSESAVEEQKEEPSAPTAHTVSEGVHESAPALVEEKHGNDSDATPELDMEDSSQDSSTMETGTMDKDDKEPTAKEEEADPTMIDMSNLPARRRISVDEADDDPVAVGKKPMSTKKAVSKILDDREFEDGEETETSSSSSSDDENEEEEQPIVGQPRKRGRRPRSPRRPENLFESSDEEEEEEKVISKQMKQRGRKRALLELESYNTPPKTASEKPKKRKRKRPVWPVGTRFVKEFPEFGTFEGRITEWDGKHYHVYYSEDEDQEELSEYEFDNYEILSVPGGGNKEKLMSRQRRRSRKNRRKRARVE